ncbi:glycoside hydrolase family 2 TIM barrel-domain containing protein [Bacteroides sp. 51]|uniref:glycoside hydrolase family 2 TIM barrel-domain containing protein n=1 Tax=Bacteroides sp. 51 TaxID=2302938 RepID=UPI0013D06F77|nr:glycoside hydrolase family 2 TIM barrel-domain containing protein [Bacteroides sp. 51]NDV80479.1 glycoside hydrolase family 2 protein [Bacteroides sp. 51]
MKRILSLFTLCLCLICEAFAVVVPSSQKTRLNEGWEFIRQDMGSVWEVMRPVRAGQPEIVPLWTPVTLPHCFNAEDAVDPDVNYYEGAGWYRTYLDLDNPYPDGRILLEFEGAGQRSEVYVYTTKVGSHIGGYDGWKVDITDAVKAFKQTGVYNSRFKGKIPVAVRCDNLRDVETIPSDMSDFNLYGGLYRYVNLVYTPAVSFERVKITPQTDQKGKKGSLDVAVSFYNPQNVTHERTISVTVKDPNGKIVIEKVQKLGCDADLAHGEALLNSGNADVKRCKMNCDVNVTLISTEIKNIFLWDVDNPQLYTCEVTLEVDGQTIQATDRFGFRHFEFIEKGPFMLNGRRVLLRGTHRHEDHAGLSAALTEELMIKEMKMIKDMGANFIRLGHYQQSDIALRLCDELGILAWEEIPWCRGGLGGEQYKTQARRMLTNMIEQHYNHPSIVLWGMGNENDWPGDFESFDKDAIRAFMKELHDLSHKLDDSRLTAIRRCEFCKDIIDVYSPSIWAGWYSRAFKDYREMSDKGFEGATRFFHAEWGGDSHARRHMEGDFATVSNAAKTGDWSESYIVRLFDWHLKEQETMPNLTGSAFWTFKDFSTPLRPENPVPYVNQKGVVERDLTPKESYYVFQSYWAKEPMVHIYGHTWPVRWGEKGEKKEVLVYSNCPEVELFVNGVSQGKKKRNSPDFPAAGLHWDVVYEEGVNTLRAVGIDKKLRIADEIAQEYQTEKWGKESQIVLSHTPLDNDTVLIQAEIRDAAGVRCLDSQAYVEFSLVGNGKLIQNQGTSIGSRKLQAYNGRAYIKAVKNGKITVCAHILSETGIGASEFITIFASE